jgi:CRISPR-associated protein Cas1
MKLLVKDRISILYCEKGYLEVDGYALVLKSGEERTYLPVGATTAIFLMPGVVVTHAAVKVCADEGTLLLWVGENGVRTYSAGQPGGACAERILHQASFRLDEHRQLLVVRKMYLNMFGDCPECRSIDQLRGYEGSKVKAIYHDLAQQFDVAWMGRDSNPGNDIINQAISFANAALYGMTEAIILVLGYSPAIGFIHNGSPRSFVFDVADCIKFKTVVPLVFSMMPDITDKNVSQIVRRECRKLFTEMNTTNRLIDLVEELMHHA